MAKNNKTFEFIKYGDFGEVVREALDKDLADISLLTETAIKNLTPVREGRLKASMVARKAAVGEYEVATNVEYAPFVEYGTSRFAGRAMMRRGAAEIQAKGTLLLKRTLNAKVKK